jgi:hypothetical protein
MDFVNNEPRNSTFLIELVEDADKAFGRDHLLWCEIDKLHIGVRTLEEVIEEIFLFILAVELGELKGFDVSQT